MPRGYCLTTHFTMEEMGAMVSRGKPEFVDALPMDPIPNTGLNSKVASAYPFVLFYGKPHEDIHTGQPAFSSVYSP